MMRISSNRILTTLGILLVGMIHFSGSPVVDDDARAFPFAPISMDAADSMLARLDDYERIAQLFVVRGSEGPNPFCAGYIDNSETPNNHTSTTDPNGLPYFYGFDLITHGSSYLSEEQLAGTNNPSLVADYAESIGRQLKSSGHNFVLGPSLDILYHDDNPMTAAHAFSDDPETVLINAKAYVKGLKKSGIQAIVGSYPGIGNSKRGYDIAPPVVFSRMHQLQRSDMVPFKGLINEGIQGVLLANAVVPAIDSSKNGIASSSKRVNKMLREDLGFNGLIWSDLSTNTKDADPLAYLLAGNDLIIVDEDLASNIESVRIGIAQGKISMELINKKVKRILQAKLWMSRSATAKRTNEPTALEVELRERKVIEASLTLLRNTDNVLPIQRLDTARIAVIKIGDSEQALNPYLANRYAPVEVFQIDINELEKGYTAYQKRSQEFNLCIVIADPQDGLSRKRFGIGEHYQSVLERIAYAQRSVVVWNGNPKGLLFLSNIQSISAIITGYRPSAINDDFALQAIFGGRALSGKLKRKVGNDFYREFGLTTTKTRLAYGIPEEVGIRSDFLKGIDDIAYGAISEKATPGAQVWFAKDGMVVVDNTYGYHTYRARDTVKRSDLYDLASITKIAGSVAGMMKLAQDSLFSLDHNLCDYLGEWVDTTEYMNMGMREIFAHQAGLPAFIPFYAKTLRKGVPRFDIYSLAQNDVYPYRVARELYIHKEQPDKMFRQIVNHSIKSVKKYKYSDVGYYFALRIIEKQSGMKMEDYLNEAYYKPLGMTTMGYRPLLKFDKKRIAPTEYDRYFRNQLVHGDVHDPGAAMLGGVGGHAGLFSNANDLGKLMQMYLNGGEYGGDHYFDSTIINDFTKCQFCDNDNRRGAGFDKPLTDGSAGPSCGCTSLDAFGHQGFTGTVTWADPGANVVYVFLSNRVYPDANNKKLAHMNIRTDIQQVFYDAIEESVKADSAENQL